MPDTQAQSAVYPEPLDAIVLAGTDGNPRRMIQGQNKAFLAFAGEPLVRRVAESLLQAVSVGRIFVVGPSDRLRDALRGLPDRVVLVEQAGKMLVNAWQGIRAAEAAYRQRAGADDPQRPLLFTSADLPLITSAAVDDFVARCAREDQVAAAPYGMLAGVAEEHSLRRYYGDASAPGIVRPYVHLAECRVRLANIYVGRPRLLAHQEFLQTGFEHRKAEKWKNVVALAWHFLGQSGGWQAAWITLRLQATLLAARGQGGLYRRLRGGNRTALVEKVCGKVLGGPIRMVITPWGGLSLDVDNDDDYRVLSRRFEDWLQLGPVDA